MENYILVTSYNRSNVQNRLWYAMDESDKTAMINDTKIALMFGDRVWVIKTKKLYVFGNDNRWYEM